MTAEASSEIDLADRTLDFLVVGSAKCASTTLQHWLAGHPDIYMPIGLGINHETGLFLIDAPESLDGLTNLQVRTDLRDDELLRTIVEGRTTERVLGERSTDYTKRPHRTVRFDAIAEHNRAMRIIYIVRDPLDQIITQYRHLRRRRPDHTSTDAIVAVTSNPLYRDVALYHYQLEPYLARFPSDQVRVVLYEDLALHPAETLAGLFEFVGVEPIMVDPDSLTRYNVNNDVDRDVALTLADLPLEWQEAFRRDIGLLQQRVDRDLVTAWPTAAILNQ